MSLYIDTSCLLKLLLVEPESSRVQDLISAEEQVIVSTLVRLEALQGLYGLRLGGRITPAQHKRLAGRLEDLIRMPPFEMRAFPPSAIENAESQNRQGAYCKTLDSLHLGAMASLGLKRLLTNDDQQASAAQALGYVLLQPR